MQIRRVQELGRGEKGSAIAETLASAIRSGQFLPGERLVESRLTDILGVSRGPLREAFRRLCAEGLVDIVPNRGAQVRRLSRKEILELFEIRAELEALAARNAARRIDQPGVRTGFEAGSVAIWTDGPRVSADDYVLENRRFHEAVFNASGNCQLFRLNDALQLSLILVQTKSALTPEVLADSVTEHRNIATAIQEGREKEAGAAMRDHLGRAINLVRALPSDMFSDE